MSSAAPASPAQSSPRSRWRFVLAPRWLAWHAFTVAAVIGMLWLGDWQFRRAVDGNALSWAYTFEWPVFAAFGLVFWAKTILDEGRGRNAAGRSSAAGTADGAAADGAAADSGAAGARRLGLPVTARPASGPAGDGDEDDPDLDEYNAYLSRLDERARSRGRGTRG